MALSAEALEKLQELEDATDAWADKEIARLNRRANLLRRVNTRVDDFRRVVEVSNIRTAISDIDSLLS